MGWQNVLIKKKYDNTVELKILFIKRKIIEQNIKNNLPSF